MSSQKYCHHCGKQVIIGARFCSACGVNLTSLTAKPAIAAEPSKPQSQFVPFVVNAADDDDDSYIDRLDHANVRQTELHVDIVKDRPQGETVGSVVTQGINTRTPPIIDRPRPAQLQDKATFLKAFQQEAGTSRHEK